MSQNTQNATLAPISTKINEALKALLANDVVAFEAALASARTQFADVDTTQVTAAEWDAMSDELHNLGQQGAKTFLKPAANTAVRVLKTVAKIALVGTGGAVIAGGALYAYGRLFGKGEPIVEVPAVE